MGNYELVRYFKDLARLLDIDFSNCYNYWYIGFLPLLITRSAFYRNRSCPGATDALVRLEMRRLVLPADVLTAIMLRSRLLLSFPSIIC